MTGLMAVFWKELADHLFSKRFLVFLLIMYVAGVATIYVAADTIRQSVSMAEGTQFIFMRLFVLQGQSLPFSFPNFLALFIPILGIALGFDAINSERSSGNLSRLLAQPVYRDSVINGKFLAGLATIFLLVTSIFFIVGGLGLRRKS
jgi:ABC-2 type transport system permease protein